MNVQDEKRTLIQHYLFTPVAGDLEKTIRQDGCFGERVVSAREVQNDAILWHIVHEIFLIGIICRIWATFS